MLPAHYAFSEILIVLVSVYALTVFFKERQFYIFAGVFLISFVALIASIRFGINYQNELKSFHQLLSAISLLFGIPLIVLEIMKRSNLLNNKIIYLVLLSATIISLFILLQAKNLIILVAASWLIIGVIFSILISRESTLTRIVSGIFFSLIIINLILRRMELFDPSTSWHLYHIGIAVWLYLLTRILKQKVTKYV
jgi:hypothetical protein